MVVYLFGKKIKGNILNISRARKLVSKKDYVPEHYFNKDQIASGKKPFILAEDTIENQTAVEDKRIALNLRVDFYELIGSYIDTTTGLFPVAKHPEKYENIPELGNYEKPKYNLQDVIYKISEIINISEDNDYIYRGESDDYGDGTCTSSLYRLEVILSKT